MAAHGNQPKLLPLAAREVLDGLPRTSPWVFPSGRTGGPVSVSVSVSALGQAWAVIRAEAGLKDVRLHDLRHMYASSAIAGGETVLTVGRLLGHNDPGTTLRYAHHAEAAAAEVAVAMGAVLGGRRTRPGSG
ncbi:MAG: tyrosine-type recombinase/integrase [Albidovulum sp.]|nr:tyrosine-type recombinase/integrase [Albidovulum sp.]